MPELPEVEIVARGLQRMIAGRRILSVTLGKTDFIDDPAAIERELPGRRIEKVERYGKFMLLRLSHANATGNGIAMGTPALLVHLGMTGNLAPSLAGLPHQKHTHVVFQLDDGRELRYTDPRRFGRIAYFENAPLGAELERFGADPLEISTKEFGERICGRRARIKALLLDQCVLRGVGNIYADESLWRARIHPAKLGSNMTREEAETLRRSLQTILRNAITLRGSSISDFLDADGRPGEYQQHHRAYGREGKKCFRCGTSIRRLTVAGRSSYFCPLCQRKPRAKRASGEVAKRRVGKNTSKRGRNIRSD